MDVDIDIDIPDISHLLAGREEDGEEFCIFDRESPSSKRIFVFEEKIGFRV